MEGGAIRIRQPLFPKMAGCLEYGPGRHHGDFALYCSRGEMKTIESFPLESL
jgi:hypothetical protein